METNRILDIHLLGTFRLTWGDQPVASFDQARLQYLLAYLLLHPSIPVSRHQLAFTFWPDTPDEQALSNLRTLLHRLRDALPESQRYLQIDRRAITWRGDAGCVSDVADFDSALTQATHTARPVAVIAALQAAIDAYAGDLLPDCYDEWILPHRERLRQAFAEALERLIILQENQRQIGAAIQNTRRLLRFDPLHEASHRHLMHLCLINGDRTKAMRAYHRCTTILRQELGVDPSPETQTLYQRLLRVEEESTRAVEDLAAPLSQLPEPRLVGRHEEWATLVGIWQAVRTGNAQMILVSGEPGVGTTRLAEELAIWVERQGGHTATARCHSTSTCLPYAVIADWLRSPALQAQLAALDNPRLAEIARLAPEVRNERSVRATPEPLVEDWQRQRFFEALAAPILLREQPLLLLIDDLHRCDGETLDWLQYLMNTAEGAPLLVVGTAHSETVLAGHPLTALRLALQQRGRWHDVRLGPLSAGESLELAGELAGRSLTPCEARHLNDDSEGNPFFLLETLRGGLLDTPEPQPDAHPNPLGPQCRLCPRRTHPSEKVRAVVEQRLAQLSPAGCGLAQTAAVVGRQFTLDILQRASSLDETALAQGLDELWRRGIVRERGVEGYDFSHDKLRAAAYAELSPSQRQFLHRRVAEALQETQTGQPGVAGLLAHHYDEAGDAGRAATFWIKAGDEARALAAPAKAGACYRRAVAILESRGDPTRAGLALMKLGVAHHAAFDFDSSHVAYAEGFDLLARQPAWQTGGTSASSELATLRLARLAPQTLDPGADDGADAWLIDQLFAGLVAEGPDMAILPDVARTWQIEDGGRMYTFHLRHDACWSDGLTITAGDFEYAWQRVLDPVAGVHFAGLLDDIAGARAYRSGETIPWDAVGVQVLDRSTLRVTLSEPANTFLFALAHRVAFPVPQHVVERCGQAWTEPASLVSNGPFRLID